jgi:hypothetical protein
MIKLAAIIGGVLLRGGVAFAGTRTLLEQTTGPAIGTTVQEPVAITTSRQEDRGRETELRGRANEPGEDVRGPCDEVEHATDQRCTGALVEAREDDEAAEARDDDDRGSNSGPSERSGHDDSSDPAGEDDDSGHGGDDDSGHGGDDD